MSVSKPAICFWKRVISIKWMNKLLIQNINLTGHRKSACYLQPLVFLEICVIAPFWHWRIQVFPKGCWHHDLKAFCEIGYKSVLLNITENLKQRWLAYYLSLLFTHLVEGPWRTGGWNSWEIVFWWHNFLDFTWLYMITFICFLYSAKEGIVAEISKVS